MTKVVWLTDIHLNFLSLNERKKFYEDIKATNASKILITGDISEATTTCIYLEDMAKTTNMPIYFVAGNHDYYSGSVCVMRECFDKLDHDSIMYLTTKGPMKDDEQLFYIGVDGWADGRHGDYKNSPVVLNDSRLIKELFEKTEAAFITFNGYEDELVKASLLHKMQELANQDAKILDKQLDLVTKDKKEKLVIVLTHVPPFPENSLYAGKIADDNYLPFYTSSVIGNLLLKYANDYPNIDFLVLCGHSHHEATFQPLSNLLVRTGDAKYHYPIIKILEF